MNVLTTKQIKDMNRMNRAAQNAVLGSRIAGSGSYVATAADASASSITIQTSLSSVNAAIVQAYRSGSPMYAVKETVSGSNLVITSSASGTWTITSGDVIVYTAV